jgi:hypothetical protein
VASETWTHRASKLRPFYLDYPGAVLAVAILFFHFSWWKLFISVLLLLGCMLWQTVVGSCYNLIVYAELYYGYLLHFRGCSFTRRPLKEFVPAAFIDHLLAERWGIGLTGYDLGYVCIVRRRVIGAPWPSAMSAFPLEFVPWYVMVTDAAEDFSPHQRFMLLHELGHVALFHRIALERKISAVAQSGFMLAVAAITTNAPPLVSGAMAALVLLWCVAAILRPTPTQLFEQLADQFALLFLSAKDLARMSSEDFGAYTQFASDEEREARQTAFERALTARRATTRDSLVNRQNAFNEFAVDRLWPLWSYLLIGAAVVLAAVYSSSGTIGSRVGVVLLALVLPTILYLVVETAVEVYHQRVEWVMETGIVSETLLFPAYLEWERRRSPTAKKLP